jgi:hypothetical protein
MHMHACVDGDAGARGNVYGWVVRTGCGVVHTTDPQWLQHYHLGYPHSSTSIFISKKKYSFIVIEILYSISISPAPVLSLSHTLYPLFYILFPSLPLSLSPLSLSLSSFPFTGAHVGALPVACYCSERNDDGSFRAVRCGRANAKCGVPDVLQSTGADSLTSNNVPCPCSCANRYHYTSVLAQRVASGLGVRYHSRRQDANIVRGTRGGAPTCPAHVMDVAGAHAALIDPSPSAARLNQQVKVLAQCRSGW